MDISCAFATSMDTPDHVARAEELGYRRAWLYDSPALYPEVFRMYLHLFTQGLLAPSGIAPATRFFWKASNTQ